MGLSSYLADQFLQYTVGKAAMAALPTVYVGLLTAIGPAAGAFTEVSGNSYARVATSAATWSSAVPGAPSAISNAAAINFPTPTGTGWGTIVGFALFDAATGGNLLDLDYLGNFAWSPCTVAVGSPATITLPQHGFSVNDAVVFTAVYGGTAATFGQSNLAGTLAVASVTTDTLTVTNGGVTVDTTASGSGMMRKIIVQPVPQNVVTTFPAGALSLTAG